MNRNRNSRSLTDLRLKSYDINSLKYVKKQFENIENVIFAGDFNQLASETLQLNEMFPKIRRLSFNFVGVENRNGIDLHFPHLEYFHFGYVIMYMIGDSQNMKSKV